MNFAGDAKEKQFICLETPLDEYNLKLINPSRNLIAKLNGSLPEVYQRLQNSKFLVKLKYCFADFYQNVVLFEFEDLYITEKELKRHKSLIKEPVFIDQSLEEFITEMALSLIAIPIPKETFIMEDKIFSSSNSFFDIGRFLFQSPVKFNSKTWLDSPSEGNVEVERYNVDTVMQIYDCEKPPESLRKSIRYRRFQMKIEKLNREVLTQFFQHFLTHFQTAIFDLNTFYVYVETQARIKLKDISSITIPNFFVDPKVWKYKSSLNLFAHVMHRDCGELITKIELEEVQNMNFSDTNLFCIV